MELNNVLIMWQLRDFCTSQPIEFIDAGHTCRSVNEIWLTDKKDVYEKWGLCVIIVIFINVKWSYSK